MDDLASRCHAWISIPLQVTVGEPATYNIIVLPMLPLAAFAAFLLCQHVTGGAFWPSVLGGYIFGFSPYMLGQVLAHLDLVAVFPVPLIVLLDAEETRRRDFSATIRDPAGRAADSSVSLFPGTFRDASQSWADSAFCSRSRCSTATFARDFVGLIAPATAGYLIAGAVLSPYLFYMLARGFPHSPIWKTGEYSADLLAFVVPTKTRHARYGAGGNRDHANISGRYL